MTQGLTFHLFWKNPQYFWNIVDYHRWEITCFSGTKNPTGKGGGTVILPICREPIKSKPKCGEHCYHCNLSSWMDYPLSNTKVEESEEYQLLKNKKVLLSPHAATFTKECLEDMSLETGQNLIDFFENKIDKNKIISL